MGIVVSVHSFRGGTGKSNVTANLAATVARQGKRVGVVDTDIQSPGIHVLFGLKQQLNRSLNDYLWGKCAIEEAAYDVSDIVRNGKPADGAVPGLFLIPSSLNAGEIALVLREGFNVGLLNDGFRSLVEGLKLDYLFIDTHHGVNEETLLSIALSDILLVILRPDNQDYQGTAVTVELARKLEVPRMLLLVNKVPDGTNLGALREKVESIYQTPVAGIFPLNLEIVRVASSEIFCLRYPNHPFTQEIERVAARLLQGGD